MILYKTRVDFESQLTTLIIKKYASFNVENRVPYEEFYWIKDRFIIYTIKFFCFLTEIDKLL